MLIFQHFRLFEKHFIINFSRIICKACRKNGKICTYLYSVFQAISIQETGTLLFRFLHSFSESVDTALPAFPL